MPSYWEAELTGASTAVLRKRDLEALSKESDVEPDDILLESNQQQAQRFFR